MCVAGESGLTEKRRGALDGVQPVEKGVPGPRTHIQDAVKPGLSAGLSGAVMVRVFTNNRLVFRIQFQAAVGVPLDELWPYLE